jgi:hypothetical protein
MQDNTGAWKIEIVTFPDGWMGSSDLGCFQFLVHATNIIWGVASQQCEKLGGYLAEPRTYR